MRILLITFVLFVACVLSAAGQTVSPTPQQVCIDQQTANKLFDAVQQLVAAKDVIAKMTAERTASDATIAAAQKVIESYKDLDTVTASIVAKYKDLIALYEQVIKTQQTMIDNLNKKLDAPKSAFQKAMSALKTIVTIAAGIAIGHGL